MEFVNPDYANLGYARPSKGNQGRSKRSCVRTERCTICGERKKGGRNNEGQVWFLMTQSRREDKLNIWRWSQQMAGRTSVHSLCSPRHVRELVGHWMATGCLHYPFASGPLPLPENQKRAMSAPLVNGKATMFPYQLGELEVERDALARVLSENPMSLNILLDELMVALECEELSPAECDLERTMRIRLRTV